MRLAVALRSVVIVLVALALAQPVWRSRVSGVSVVYALDVSSSISPAFIEDALKSIRAADAQYKPSQARYVMFGEQARLVDSIDAVRDSVGANSNDLKSGKGVDRGGTNLQRALELSRFGFAGDYSKRLVLMTDGNQTQGDVWQALPSLQAQGVRVYTVSAPQAISHDARVEAVETAKGVRQMEAATVKVRVFSLSVAKARVALSVENEPVAAQAVTLARGANEFVFTAQFKHAGNNTVSARVFAEGDELPQNDVRTETVWVAAQPKVLYVEGTSESVPFLRNALLEQGIDVSSASVEQLFDRFAGHDAVILSDVSAKQIDAATARRLEVFVRDGGALFFAAGENTYGEEGYAEGTVERLLPVQFQRKRTRRELDLVLLIDRSFSMGGQNLELAKAAALATLDLFDERHRLAIVTFDSTLEDVLPLHEVGNKSRAQDLINDLFAAGQTNIFNALWYAHHLLEDSPAKARHIILLSDGQSGRPGEPIPGEVSDRASALLRELRSQKPAQGSPGPEGDEAAIAQGVRDTVTLLSAAGIKLSTVTIGDEPNLEVMSGLANGTGGKSYVPHNDAEIPSLFVEETKRLMGESLVEKPFHPIARFSAAALAGLDFAAAPPLKGFVMSKAKPHAEVLLETEDRHPVLVQTHYGLGRTVAFLSDVKNRWAVDWLGWSGYGKLWAQLIRAGIRRDGDEELALTVSREGTEAVAMLSAASDTGTFRNELAPRLRVTEPTKNPVVVPLRQIGPGLYRAYIPLPRTHLEPYRFDLEEGSGVSREAIARTGSRSLSYAYRDELRAAQPNVALLKSLSEQTAGKFAATTAEIFAEHSDAGSVAHPMWQYFAGAALLVYLLDILARRLPVRSRVRPS